MTVSANILTRKEAEALVDLGKESCDSLGLDARKFWSVVSAMATDLAGLTAEADACEERWRKRLGGRMTDDEARKFGDRTVGFGKHADDRWDDVPLDYLEWLAESQREKLDILRYYESRRVQAEVE